MSNIITNIVVQHQDTGMNFQYSGTRAATGSGFSSAVIEVGTSEETIGYGDVANPRQVALRLLSGSDVQVGTATGVYPLRLSGAGDHMILRLDVEGLREKQTVTTVADVADDLDGTYLTLEGKSGTWAIWIDVDNSGTTEPAHGMDASVEVTGIVTNDTAATVAAAIYAALTASTAFMADFDVAYNAVADDDLITITDKNVGTRTNLADTGSTGFSVSTTQAGAASPTVYLKSTGTSQVVVAVIPA